MDLAAHIRNIPDFPKPGIQFKDISTLLLVPAAFREVIRRLRERSEHAGVDAIVGIDARGFVFGGALAVLASRLLSPRRPAVATGAETSPPSKISRPARRWASSARARRQPLLASASTKGSVALLSAKVDVRGVAPGMLVTQ